MDPVNLLVGINLFVSSAANYSGAKKGLKSSVSGIISKPKSYLQKTPPNISALVLVLLIIGIFKIGTIEISSQTDYLLIRIIGLVIFIIFSWLQVKSYKSLGENYTQDIAVLKNQKIVTTGIYKFIRHPQYLSQILSDLGAAIALLSDIAVPVILFIELPLFILRAREEEKLMLQYYKDDYESYRKNSGFFIPFLG